MIPLYTRHFSDVFQYSARQISAKHPTFMIAPLQLLRIAHSFQPPASAYDQRKALEQARSGIFFNQSAVFLTFIFVPSSTRLYLYSTHALIFGGKIIACPVDWQATGGEKLFINYNAFSFPCLFCFIFSSLKYNEHAVKGKKETLGPSRRKKIFCYYVRRRR